MLTLTGLPVVGVGVDAVGGHELVDQGRFADAGRAQDADRVGGRRRLLDGGGRGGQFLRLGRRQQRVAARTTPPERVASVHNACNKKINTNLI